MKHVSRKNPTKEWYLGPNFLKNDKDGYLINPDTNDIYWYHGMTRPLDDEFVDIETGKESDTLYLSSSIKVAWSIIDSSLEEWRMMGDDFTSLVYAVRVKVSADAIFDIRKVIDNSEYRALANILLPEANIPTSQNMEDIVEFLQHTEYDFNFNDVNEEVLLNNGFLGWVETEYYEFFGPTLPLTLALLQNEAQAKSLYTVIKEEREDFTWDDHHYDPIPIPRENPKKNWYLGPNFLKNDKDGYLINPATNDIYWYHGSRYAADSSVFAHWDTERRASDTLYISSSEDTAHEFAAMEFQERFDLLFVVYKLKIQIPSRRIFDVRRAVDDPEFKKYASELIDFDNDCETYTDAASEMNFEVYDYHFNTPTTMKSLLSHGFLGWLETEQNVAYMPTNAEDLTLALFQEHADHLCFIEDWYTFSITDRDG